MMNPLTHNFKRKHSVSSPILERLLKQSKYRDWKKDLKIKPQITDDDKSRRHIESQQATGGFIRTVNRNSLEHTLSPTRDVSSSVIRPKRTEDSSRSTSVLKSHGSEILNRAPNRNGKRDAPTTVAGDYSQLPHGSSSPASFLRQYDRTKREKVARILEIEQLTNSVMCDKSYSDKNICLYIYNELQVALHNVGKKDHRFQIEFIDHVDEVAVDFEKIKNAIYECGFIDNKLYLEGNDLSSARVKMLNEHLCSLPTSVKHMMLDILKEIGAVKVLRKNIKYYIEFNKLKNSFYYHTIMKIKEADHTTYKRIFDNTPLPVSTRGRGGVKFACAGL